MPTPHSGEPSIPPARFTLGPEAPGDLVGPYRLLSEIGEGGFGSVWLAERREPFVQRVAIKFIKPGMDSRAVVARFEQERQALALMNHPNVARVLDGGLTAPEKGSRPYFVMEYVKGEPITAYCDRYRLTIRQRLELFIPVCEAVQHAHMKGIIHRDLKPSNILVSAAESLGSASPGSSREGTPEAVHGAVVKVIDFGVAKAISHTLTQQTLYTEQGQFIGTPEYMSPEQAEMGALDIDTRTDIYSLGVVLYQMLTGALPFDSKAMRAASLGEIQRMIRETDPPRPSTRLSSMGEPEAAEHAGRRQSQVHTIARELRRELEWIPLKAMRKDRTRRYETALELAQDIRRYLDGQALVAGPESTVYRARKFLSRNRGPAIAGFAALAALGVGLSFSTIGFIKAEKARAAETRQRATAQDNAQRAARNAKLADAQAEQARQDRVQSEQVSAFLAGLLAKAADARDRGLDTRLIGEMLDEATARIDQGELRSSPAAEARLRVTIGDARLRLDDPARAEPMFRRALDLARGAHPLIGADAAEGLAGLQDSRGRLPEALVLLDEAVAMRRQLAPSAETEAAALAERDLPSTIARSAGIRLPSLHETPNRVWSSDWGIQARGSMTAAEQFMKADRLDEAEQHARVALEYYRLNAADHPNVPRALRLLARIAAAQGDPAAASSKESLADEVERRIVVRRGELAATLHRYGLALVRAGRSDDARSALREALAIRTATLGPEHPETRETGAAVDRLPPQRDPP